MSLVLTEAAIVVGTAVAKWIFKLWVKDSALANDISSSLIDLMAQKTSDALAKRKGNRQFEEIGDIISEEILPLFENEGIQLDEGERNAVARSVAESLNKTRLSKELLLERNLQPTLLEQQVLTTNPDATRGLNEAAIQLYNRVINQCCTYAVDSASQLPAFTTDSFAEILKREDLIIRKVNEVLYDLRKIRERLDSSKEADRFEKEYREAVARNLDMLHLIGANVSLPNRRHRLSVAYITLSVVHKASPSHNNTFSGSLKEREKINIVSVDDALASSQRILISGPAGSGKTTLLQWIAVRAATNSFEEQMETWNGKVPFYIRLRHYNKGRLPKPENFPDFAASAIVGTMPEQWVHTILRKGRALLLIDGVDEISVAQREEVHSWLRDLVNTYPANYFVVTSRPHAIEEGWMNREAFSEMMLLEMTLADIFSFINHWHEAVMQELLIEDEKNELLPLAEHLKEQVRRTRSIRNFATNPLLCAMLCALNRERRRQLPVNRIELYSACCSLLLERRDKESHIDNTDYPELNYVQKQRLLEDLAYWMIRENLTEAETAVVDERFAIKLRGMPNIPQDTAAKDARRLLVERSGIIREPITGQVDFTHRTFQEFFAARAALDDMDINRLIDNAHNDQWRETIILTAGLATKELCELLVGGLIERGDRENNNRYQLHLLAVSCLETAIELGSDIQALVEKNFIQLVPPKDMTGAAALAAAGELAVKYLDKKQLKQRSALSDSTCAACIRALTLIGGDSALDMLEGYVDDTSKLTVNELLNAWDAFDREIYAKRILAQAFSNTLNLHLQKLSSLDGIQYLTNMRTLSLSNCDQLRDLTPLCGLTNLSSLSLSLDHLEVLNLTGLSSLTELVLSRFDELKDISLIGLTNLSMLDLSAYYELENIILAGLTKLSTLVPPNHKQRWRNREDYPSELLSKIHQLKSISLTDLPNLSKLDLSDRSQLKSISLTDLPNLSKLDLSKCSQLGNISLTGLTNLRWLNLVGCSQLEDLTLLTNLTAVDQLYLSGCSQLEDLTQLSSLIGLRRLNLSGCSQLVDVSPLASLTNLRWLSLSGCSQLVDVSSLAGLTSLTELEIRGCHLLRDIRPLTDLPNLKILR